MSQCNFHVGQKVVFVGGYTHYERRNYFFGLFTRYVAKENLEVGGIYTITKVGLGRDTYTGERAVCVSIKELPDDPEFGFHANRFRPVIPRKTSIKIFTDILKEVEAKEPVEGLPW